MFLQSQKAIIAFKNTLVFKITQKSQARFIWVRHLIKHFSHCIKLPRAGPGLNHDSGLLGGLWR